MAGDPGKERRPVSLNPLQDTIVSGQDALKRLARALDALQATAKASSQQDYLLTCLDALQQLEQTLGTVHHAMQQETPPQ
jgi:hypothetical protein